MQAQQDSDTQNTTLVATVPTQRAQQPPNARAFRHHAHLQQRHLCLHRLHRHEEQPPARHHHPPRSAQLCSANLPTHTPTDIGDTCRPLCPPAFAQLLQRRLAQQQSQRGQAVSQHDGQADPENPPSCAGLPVANAAWRPALASCKGAQDAVACSMHDMLQSMVSGTSTRSDHVLCQGTP